MSIYSSYPDIGLTEDDALDGTVRQYAGSHVWPGRVDGFAYIALASIPGFCVPGAPPSAEESDTVGEYLRLDIADTGLSIRATVVLNVASATELREQLDAWITRPKEQTGA